MQITVRGRHVGVDERVRAHVEQRLESSVRKYFGSAIDAQVVFTKEARQIETEIAIHIGQGIAQQSHATAAEMIASFDLAADKLEKRLRRQKRRLRDHHKGHTNPDRDAATGPDDGPEAGAADEPIAGTS